MIVGESRGPGPGPARLRARARRRHDRADDQPPVPRRARRPASACARETGDRREPRQRLDASRSTLAREAVGDLADRNVVDHRRRRDERADGAGARRPGRHDDLRRQPPRRPRPRARRALRRRRRLARRAARAAARRRHRRRLDLVAARRSSAPRSSSSIMQARARRPLVLIDIAVPRDIEPGVRATSRASRSTTSTTCRPSSRATSRSARARRASAEAVVEEEIQRFARWMAQLEVRADDRRAARARRRRSSTRSWPRTPAAGSRASPRDLRRDRGDRARGDAAAAARADGAAEGRRAASGGHGRQRSCASCSGSRRPRRGAEPPPTDAPPPTSARCSAGREARHARQRARARAGRRASPTRSAGRRGRDDHDERATATARRGDKERWVREIDAALLARRRSTSPCTRPRTSPRSSPTASCIAAVAAAGRPARRALRGRGLAELPDGARVGTSSLRRAAQLRALRGDLEILELRGNVDTRLRAPRRRRLRRDRARLAGLRAAGPRGRGDRDTRRDGPGRGACAVPTRGGMFASAPSVPIPKFASFCGTLVCELRNRRTLATY